MASFALEHLTFAYPGQTRPALDDLTLTIPEGAVTVLCGESGSGGDVRGRDPVVPVLQRRHDGGEISVRVR